jgi:hypothetical protein
MDGGSTSEACKRTARTSVAVLSATMSSSYDGHLEDVLHAGRTAA